MNLKELYFSHTLNSSTCPICNSTLGIPNDINYNISCSCGFEKWQTGFNIYVNKTSYVFNITNNLYETYSKSNPDTKLDFDLSKFNSYHTLLNHILKLEVFK